MNNNNKIDSLNGCQAEIRYLEEIYGVSIDSVDKLRALSYRLGIPVGILLMPVDELREVAKLLR